mmetsp:Transcript_59114/g.93763  ORF Transcript_59114/g.93763 Transcript_59114/m.93763 type:complete len:92 (+) Transcript_59114:484-759(+)
MSDPYEMFVNTSKRDFKNALSLRNLLYEFQITWADCWHVYFCQNDKVSAKMPATGQSSEESQRCSFTFVFLEIETGEKHLEINCRPELGQT